MCLPSCLMQPVPCLITPRTEGACSSETSLVSCTVSLLRRPLNILSSCHWQKIIDCPPPSTLLCHQLLSSRWFLFSFFSYDWFSFLASWISPLTSLLTLSFFLPGIVSMLYILFASSLFSFWHWFLDWRYFEFNRTTATEGCHVSSPCDV